MANARYVALLRGINVGGKNLISMPDLRSAFEDEGFGEVSTYIQSGNVLFSSERPRAALEDEIEAALERRLGVPLVVVVRSHRQLRSVVERAPDGFGQKPDEFHSDVVFLKGPLTSKQVMGVVAIREGVDQAWPGSGVVYFARLSAQRTKSRMSKIASTPEYKRMTIRSWRTTTKLLALLDEPAGG